MTDYTELKRLADDLNSAIEKAEHKPGQWAGTAQSMGGICCPVAPFDISKPWAKEEPWANFSFKRDSWLAVAAVNALPQLLALIADNERLTNRLEVDPRHDYDSISTRDATVKVLDEQVDQLKADNERLRADYAGLARFNPEWDRVAAAQDSVREHMAMVVQLKAENAGLKTGYEAYERVNAELKAEVEGLRDDLEQKQYDANAWRNSEESVWIEVFNSEGDDPFISAITGQITVEQLALIQSDILEYREDYFEKGSGLYVFRCAHYQAHYDNVGMTEPAHWETDFESYSPFPWEEESAALGQGEQS